MKQKNYFEKSPIWEMYGAKTKKQYVDKYVIKGNFHSNVPSDIIKSYETAEYLIAHSYYHWPMFDESLKKLLGIFEMAIKLKCEHIGINIKYKDKNCNSKTITT